MSKALNHDLVYNFGSNGQTLKESFLYYPKIQKSTKRILQFIRIEDFEDSLKDLEEPVLRNFALYGYSYNPEAETLLGNNELNYLTNTRLKINFDARIITTNVINRSFRRVFRKDLNLEDAENDLFFPNVYSQRVDAETYAFDIKKFNPSKPLTQFTINENIVHLLIRARQYFRQKNMEYTIVLYPINPDLYNYTNEYKKDALKKIEQAGLPIINCINMLDGTDFVDYWHISRPGAHKLTDRLVDQLHAF